MAAGFKDILAWLLHWKSSPKEYSPPYSIAAAQVHVSGTAVGQIFTSGTVAGQTFVAGTVVGEVNSGGTT